MTSVLLVDDHNLLRNAMAELISRFEGYSVCGQAANGKELIDLLSFAVTPDIIILDIQMPVLSGEDTAKWLKKNRPEIKILVLTMYNDELNIIRMIRAGVSGYILKDVSSAQLKDAMDQVRDNGVYHSDIENETLKRVALSETAKPELKVVNFTLRETEFLKLACTDLTYKEIAAKMGCAVRTIDGYRDDLFNRLGIKSRIGLALYAIKRGIAQV